jgi:hypothetical protein
MNLKPRFASESQEFCCFSIAQAGAIPFHVMLTIRYQSKSASSLAWFDVIVATSPLHAVLAE